MKFSHSPTSGDSKFLKLSSGDKHVGVFVGEPDIFYVKWVDKKPANAMVGEKGAKFRFRMNFVLKDFSVKVVESGAMVYNALKDLEEAGYDIENTWVKLSREGSGLNDTTYAVLPVPNGAINPADKQKINEALAKEGVHAEAPVAASGYEVEFP